MMSQIRFGDEKLYGQHFKPSSRNRASRAQRRAFYCVGSTVVAAVAIQAMFFTAEMRWPEICDADYGHKLERLESLIETHPDRPLVLLLGSSRTLFGLRPDLLSAKSREYEGAPLIFNFGMPGAGPIMQRIYLCRLLDRDIRPSSILIEVTPFMLHQHAAFGEELLFGHKLLTALNKRDLDRAAPLLRDESGFRSRWWLHSFHREYLWRAITRKEFDQRWLFADSLGWMSGPTRNISREERARRIEETRQSLLPALTDFEVTDVTDRAMRRLLDLCRARGIDASLYLMPEGSEFRSWYPAESRTKVDDYLAKLARKYDCAIYDATHWAADEELIDSHHLLPHGAEVVSRRFSEQVADPVCAQIIDQKRSGQQLARRAAAQRAQ